MSTDSSRSERLAKLFVSVLRGKRAVTDASGVKLFLEAIRDQQDRAACIEKIVASPAALNALRAGLRFDVRPDFINQSTGPFIKYLSDPAIKQLCNGQLLQDLLIVIVHPPTLWNALLDSYKNRLLSEDAVHAFAWLLLELLSLPATIGVDVHEDIRKATADGYLIESPSPEIRTFGRKIQQLLLAKSSNIPVDPGHAPGGRHDNDFADFRQIAIYPTGDEFLCTEKPFYRRADAIFEAPPEHRVAMHLDNQFRLLREDMVSELRDDLQNARGKKKGRRSALVLRKLSAARISCGDEKRWKHCALALKCESGLEQLTNLPPSQRKQFLTENRNFLKHQAFGCLICGDQIVAFATVDRDVDALIEHPPVLTLRILGDEALVKTLMFLKMKKDLEFLLVETPFFAYEPVLRCLQENTDLPFAKELLGYEANESIPEAPLVPDSVVRSLKEEGHGNVQHILRTTKDIRLDPSQLESLIAGITQPLTLIQGPPGTGKSFIGALLSKVLHDYTHEKILVLCYTNHALDQFLEDFLDIGISQDAIVRLGSKYTPRTAGLSLSEQRPRHRLSQSAWNIIEDLKHNANKLKRSLDKAFDSYKGFVPTWKHILEYLEFSEEDAHFYDALKTPEEEDGMIRVGRRGRQATPDYLYDRWSKGMDAGIFRNKISQESKIVWQMDNAVRQACITKWTKTILEEQVTNLHGHIQLFDRYQERLDKMLSEKTLSILKGKRIIGCTTTAAAMFSRDLRSISPGVVLVEEAGEILESHILTALSPQAKRLVLIGDHKQLRPKVNNYALTVEKGDGYDLNRSLFERLVLGGHPHTTLYKQHRMCPEISDLVRRLTYPDLLDDEKTLNRPRPRGLQDRVIFFNHEHLEASASEIADRRDEGAKVSKRNQFEAEMVLKIVRYLGQQGYGTDKLVVLTPYLGQLNLLRRMLAQETDPILNDLDTYDLVRAGLLSQASAQHTKRPIRLSTIDNYQGEESEIVIVSLTRGNTAGDIGFMAAPQRLNVLISRARNALIMIGNAETFRKSKKGKETWVPFLDHLNEGHHLYDGLPVKCERHPQTMDILKNKEDFDTKCPDGGCSLLCGAKLSCGIHDCPQRCHQLFDHSKMKCDRIVEWVCPRNHKISRLCFQNDTVCRKCATEDRRKEIKRLRDHKLDAERERKQREYAQQLAEVQDEIAHQRRLLRDQAEEREREKILQQHKQDLENLKNAVRERARLTIKDREPEKTTVSTVPSHLKANSTGEKSQNALKDQESDIFSSANKEWKYQKEFEGARNDAIDTLMDMIGLEEVKEKFLSIKARVDTAVRQNIDLKGERFGAVLLGNPGTGKTTVARLYAKFLTSVGALPGSFIVETTGSRLANEGIPGCKKQIEEILNNGGGALFIDEAYQLASGTHYAGAQVLDFLLAEIENLVGKMVVILAGYNRQMEAFFAHNPGLPSRFPHELKFKDYEDDELLRILAHKINKKYEGRMKIEGGMGGLYTRIVARRIGRGRGREGFGNAREVENVCARIAERQATRLRKERRAGVAAVDDMLLTKEDMIGPEPSRALQNCQAWKELQNLIGLRAVKESVRALINTIQYNYCRELEEKPLVEFSLNRVFLGSPGTGKTSVAKLYGQILADIGLLSNGEVVVKNPADFVGGALGESEKNTKGILASTVGKVLVIDEAYGLYGGGGDGGGSYSDPYKTAVIDTIVAEVQSTPGEDRCVLLLGYKDQMEHMFQKVNPGLSRRFPLDSAFVFEDFTDDELAQILDLKLKQQGFETTERGKKAALDVLRRARNRPHFGNAGEVDILLNAAKARHQRRLLTGTLSQNADKFEAQDFDEDFDRAERAETNIPMLFKGVVGCDGIVAQLEGYRETARNMKKLDMDPREQVPFNFLFRGPPGTGKTTTARKMGKVYYDMGLLSTAEVIECSATDLVGEYVGQTGPKTQKLLEKALGKVLFIDEAYRLAEGHFAKEAMDELVDCITKPKFARKLIIILAGYDEDINRLMSINPGLSSRFPEAVIFKALSADECTTLLTKLLQGQKHRLSQKKVDLDIAALESPREDFLRELRQRFETLSQLPNWANARDIETLAKSVFGEIIKDAKILQGQLALDEKTILEHVDSMIAERTHRGGILSLCQDPKLSDAPKVVMDIRPQFPPVTSQTRHTFSKTQHDYRPPEIKQNIQPATVETPRDPGVSDEVWQRLQNDRIAAEAREQAYKQLLEQERAMQDAISQLQKAGSGASEAAKKAAIKDDDEAKRRHEEERLRHELARREHEAKLEELRRKKQEAEERRKKELEAQKKLRKMGLCPAGYRWIRQASGYRCAGGSHFVSHAELERL